MAHVAVPIHAVMTPSVKLPGWYSDPLGMESLVARAIDRAVRSNAPASIQIDLKVALAESIMFQGRIQESRQLFLNILETCPEHESALWCEAILSFLNEDPWPGPWKKLESRWALNITGPRPCPADRIWDGSPLNGRSLTFAGEGGLGDQIQFIRFAPLLKAAGAGSITVSVHQSLIPLFSSAAAADHLTPAAVGYEPPGLVVPMLSAPSLLGTVLDTLPASVPYLWLPDAANLEAVQRLGPDRKKTFNVGLCWDSDQPHKILSVDAFRPLLGLSGVRLFGLGEHSRIAQSCAALPMENLGSRSGDIIATAAAVEALDLVISIDTMVAHLAGSLNMPVWTLLEALPDWRWSFRGETTPWYPSMRLFRCEGRNWETLIRRLALKLAEAAHAGTSDGVCR
ncbi:MAG TPA: hypothetical protein VG273_12630 [Bryobacteraceae bacterium]|jgi:hypothetical protein|nr:hypothetical protein [Bryobacteraceae bacterium]